MGYGNRKLVVSAGGSDPYDGEIVRTELIQPPYAEELFAETATETETWSHDITLDLDHPMNVGVSFMFVFSS